MTKLPAAALLLALAAAPAAAARNVILVTIDGVRWQEYLSNLPDPQLSKDTKPVFPNLSRRDKEGVILGDASLGSTMVVSNLVTLSLPAYQSIMAGRMTGCLKNECGRTKADTVVERLAKDLKLAPADLRVVSGWANVPLAVERSTGTALVDAPASGSRADSATWAAFKLALDAKPRFLWLAFNDPDDRAHADDYQGYIDAIRYCDARLDELFTWLDASGDYGRDTAVLVTTDHGRGDGKDYTSHGGRPAAARVWLYARGSGLKSGGRLGTGNNGSHAEIRATIESLFGLKPSGPTLPGLLAP